MRELPILVSTPMVQAIQAGRKTMTRRVIKPQPTHFHYGQGGLVFPCKPDGEQIHPRYQVGDNLWVRETWCPLKSSQEAFIDGVSALGVSIPTVYKQEMDDGGATLPPPFKWKSGRFMPKWASRIWLEVTVVKAERLQDITEEDAWSEGVVPESGDSIAAFAQLWDSLNGKTHPWASNCWVWAYTFKVVSK